MRLVFTFATLVASHAAAVRGVEQAVLSSDTEVVVAKNVVISYTKFLQDVKAEKM